MTGDRDRVWLPRTGETTYVAMGRDEFGWWEQTEPGGPLRYGADVEARIRAVLPSWMLDELGDSVEREA